MFYDLSVDCLKHCFRSIAAKRVGVSSAKIIPIFRIVFPSSLTNAHIPKWEFHKFFIYTMALFIRKKSPLIMPKLALIRYRDIWRRQVLSNN